MWTRYAMQNIIMTVTCVFVHLCVAYQNPWGIQMRITSFCAFDNFVRIMASRVSVIYIYS